jgi:hypothetical protein
MPTEISGAISRPATEMEIAAESIGVIFLVLCLRTGREMALQSLNADRGATWASQAPSLNETSTNPDSYGERFVKRRGLFCLAVTFVARFFVVA